ncbi:MAG: HRDC domain-containing protein [Burkholderiaceae bacterium]
MSAFISGSARDVLRGEVQLLLREASAASAGGSGRRGRGSSRGGASKDKAPPVPLDAAATERFTALKAWRAEVAREHNLPAYVVFHDATLAEMARACPQTLDDIGEISGVGAKKLDAYGREILRVLAG